MSESCDYIFTLQDTEIKDLAISLHKLLASKHADIQLGICAIDNKLLNMYNTKQINKGVYDTLRALIHKLWDINNNMEV